MERHFTSYKSTCFVVSWTDVWENVVILKDLNGITIKWAHFLKVTWQRSSLCPNQSLSLTLCRPAIEIVQVDGELSLWRPDVPGTQQLLAISTMASILTTFRASLPTRYVIWWSLITQPMDVYNNNNKKSFKVLICFRDMKINSFKYKINQ